MNIDWDLMLPLTQRDHEKVRSFALDAEVCISDRLWRWQITSMLDRPPEQLPKEWKCVRRRVSSVPLSTLLNRLLIRA